VAAIASDRHGEARSGQAARGPTGPGSLRNARDDEGLLAPSLTGC
jgi:hypothetical protein